MSRNRALCALAVFTVGLFGLTQMAQATCTRLTPASLRHSLDDAQAVFAFDDEGQEQSPLYLTLLAINDDGTFQGTLSATILPTPKLGSTWAVSGTLIPTAPGVLSVSLSFEQVRNVFTTYAGAIKVFPSCYLAMAGTYSTERVLQTVSHHLLGPVPFSGKVVRVPVVSAAE